MLLASAWSHIRRVRWIENSAGGAGGQDGNRVGVRRELRGASWNLVLCQWGIKVQCVRSWTVPPSLPTFFSHSLPLRKDIESTDCQSAGGSSFNAVLSSCFLAFTVVSLFLVFLQLSLSCCAFV